MGNSSRNEDHLAQIDLGSILKVVRAPRVFLDLAFAEFSFSQIQDFYAEVEYFDSIGSQVFTQ